jgi:hypothetical protein
VVALFALVAGPGCGLFDQKADVLLIGDSIMKQGGEYVEEALESRDDIGSIAVENAGVNGSGLLTPGEYDWHREAEELVAELDPEIIVVLFVGNYASGDGRYVGPDGQPVEGYTPEFFSAWGAEADRLMEILTADGAEVYWVQPPPMLLDEGARRVSELRTTYQLLADRWPGTGVIDGTAALAGTDGGFSWELPDDTGAPQVARAADSVHLTAFGSRLLGEAIADALAPSVVALEADD